MHQSAPKEAMISIIYIRYLDIAVKKDPTIQLKCMGLSSKSSGNFDTCKQCAITKARQKKRTETG
jgi:hypothetical protein